MNKFRIILERYIESQNVSKFKWSTIKTELNCGYTLHISAVKTFFKKNELCVWLGHILSTTWTK